jgi:hypothetical protein
MLSPITRRWPLGLAVAVVGLVLLALWPRAPAPRPEASGRMAAPTTTAQRTGETERGRLPEGLPDAANEEAAAEPPVPFEGELDVGGEPMGGTWESVDMNAVRAALPDNLYWQNSAPTTDEQIIEERERERARWNIEYGKVLSGTGTDEEIRAYYDYKSRQSADSIEFATYLLDHHGDALPDRDVMLLKLARRLHQARLEEVPRKLEEAFERKRAQDAARAAWLADQAAFEAEADAKGQ